ncbi:membrane-spanning 4-domains subfamily A member 8-like [Engraulis encrasicolus]|uniref:membrane-spanning 4-domains subfamily A member 8-like n=1 Tax=Engraulis encrasicolus TaxID=184585 RepID=UPI002FD08F57
MSVTVTKMEGVTVFTVTSNEKSNCPLLCQILGNLCCSPVCSVSQRLKKRFGGTQATLGAIQILIGLFSIGIGTIILLSHPYYNEFTVYGVPIWLGVLFMWFGVMCTCAERCPSPCLVVITGIMNVASAAFAITAIVMYAVDISWLVDSRVASDQNCEEAGIQENIAICKKYNNSTEVLLIGMEITMVVFATIQLFVAIAACVVALQAPCKKESERAEHVSEDPELHQPWQDEMLSNPTA